MGAHFPPLCDYYVVNDSSPGTHLWSVVAGGFVLWNDATYQAWIPTVRGDPSAFAIFFNIIDASSASGGAATSLHVLDTSLFTSNQSFNVSGTGGLYDGNQTITVLDATHVTIPVAFVSTATGFLTTPQFIATAAALNTTKLNAYSLTLPLPKYTAIALSGSPTAASLPMALVTDVVPNTSDGAVLNLPQANLPNSPPIGQPFTLVGQGSGSTIHDWVLKDFGGNTIGTFGSNEGVIVWNTSNASSAGTWEGFRTRNVTPPAGDAQILTSGSSWQQTLVWLASTPSGDVTMADGGVFTVTTCVKTVKVQKFTGSGTYTPSTGMLYCTIEAVGGGGGGGGATTPNNVGTFAGGGGGAGGYSRLTASAATIGASQTVTIGGGGNGGVAGANNGANGVDTSVGTLCIGKAGSGGLFGSQAQVGQGGAGGVAGTGDITAAGAPGGNGIYENAASSVSFGSGFGGSSHFGGGAQSVGGGGAVNGNNAGNYGGGGGGGLANGPVIGGAGNAAGGNGSAGFVIITEFCNR